MEESSDDYCNTYEGGLDDCASLEPEEVVKFVPVLLLLASAYPLLLLFVSVITVLLLLYSASAVFGMTGFCKLLLFWADFVTASTGNFVKFLFNTSA